MGLKLTAKQVKAWSMLTSQHLGKFFFGGGKRSGKTDVVIEFINARALQYPGSAQLIARKNRNAAEESIWGPTGSLTKYLHKFIPKPMYERNEAKLRLDFYNGSVIQVGGLDDKERTEKTFGNEYLTIYLNEATQLTWATAQTAFTLASQVCHDDQGYQGVPKIILDCNPRGPRHWVKRACIEHIDPKTNQRLADADDWGVISNWTPYDNLANLSPEYVKTLENLPSVMRDRMLSGLWTDNEGLVYNEFNEQDHICTLCKTKPAKCPMLRSARSIVCGCDFGYMDPFCWLWGVVDRDGRLTIVDELYKTQTIVEDHAKQILKRGIKWAWAVADHDSEDAATLRRHDVLTRPAKKTKPIKASIDLVKARLKVQGDGRPRLRVCQYAVNLVDNFYNYMWHDKKSDVPVDGNDHGLDPLRYMVTELDLRGGNTGVLMVR